MQLILLANVHKHITTLEKKGFIRRGYNQSRSIEILQLPKSVKDQVIERKVQELPLVGRIAAGRPLEAVEERETLSLGDFARGGTSFALQVKGTSMIEDHIMDGDFVVCEQTQVANSGEIVVALIIGGAGLFSKLGVLLAILASIIACPAKVAAYSVLSHEAIIDSAWDTNIKPLLLKRFPDATPEELREAHGYAYGGAIIQDMGYYPHGSMFFSDLAHYVRSGDFVLILLRDSKDLNEYAFALGALAHYAADNNGHRIGTNRAVPILYPKLRKKHGDSVTYEDDPLAHVKTELGFDVLEVAKERYAPHSYHDCIS